MRSIGAGCQVAPVGLNSVCDAHALAKGGRRGRPVNSEGTREEGKEMNKKGKKQLCVCA